MILPACQVHDAGELTGPSSASVLVMPHMLINSQYLHACEAGGVIKCGLQARLDVGPHGVPRGCQLSGQERWWLLRSATVGSPSGSPGPRRRARGAHAEWFCSIKVAIWQVRSRHIQRRLNRLFALWGVGVVVEASRGSWTVSWDDDRTQEFTLGASSTKTRMQFGYPNFLQRPKTLQFQRCDFNV